jgi:hypothetical protein
MVRYSFLVRLSHPLLHAGLSRRISDHLIRPCQHIRWNRQADLLSRREIDDELQSHLDFADFLGAPVVGDFDQIQVGVTEVH